MNVSVVWEKVSRANMEDHEAAGRVAFYLARDITDPIRIIIIIIISLYFIR